jgi:hypothetical protein
MLAIDLFCGLGGWTDGLLAEDFDVIGFDVERHDYGTGGYPGQLVLQDVMTIDGAQFQDASLIVASPPCQEFSYMAMPWSRAKQIEGALHGSIDEELGRKYPFPDGYKGSRTVAELTALFDACFRIQLEASAAAGRHIPMVVENVKGAQKWVGKAQANFGSYYLWGDAGMVGRRVVAGARFGEGVAPSSAAKVPGFRFDGSGGSFQTASVKVSAHDSKEYGGNFGWDKSVMRQGSSKSPARKAASAMIAKIPFALSRYIARAYRP